MDKSEPFEVREMRGRQRMHGNGRAKVLKHRACCHNKRQKGRELTRGIRAAWPLYGPPGARGEPC